jgi:hypothetical protein|tara:strand:- start:1306 stop:2493 length:1188 start_codon:yes stop_codon:yes gene_type:complete
MAWKKVVTESTTGKITQEAASLLNQGALATLGAVDSAQITNGSIDTAHIANDQITSALMANDAVSGEIIADEGISQGKLADNSVQTNTIEAANITLAKMASESVDEDNLLISNNPTNGQFLSAQSGNAGGLTWAVPTDISNLNALTDTTIDGTPADGEVLVFDTTNKWQNQTLAETGIQPALGSGDVTSSMIGLNTVALNNMANLAANTFIGRDTESTGVPEALSVSTVKTMLSLGNVTNTTDANKPVSTAQQTEIDTKAELAGSGTQDFSAQNLSVTGNLSITGTSEIRNTTTETINVADNTIVLNSDKSSTADVDAGIVVERGGDGNNKSIYWDEGKDKWSFGESASAVVAGTYQGDVASIDVNANYQSGSTVVPVGHFQYDTLSRTLYVRYS